MSLRDPPPTTKEATDLFQLLEDENWDHAVLHCIQFPEEASTWIVKGGKMKFRRLPLHEACIRRATCDVIECLLSANPSAIRACDENGRLPLHHAAFYGSTKKTMLKLIMAFPESIDVLDSAGKTPLALAQVGCSIYQNDIVALLSKGLLYYIVKREEKKWNEREERRIMQLMKEFNEERSLLEDKLARQQSRKGMETEDTKQHIDELEDEVATLISKCDDLLMDNDAKTMARDQAVAQMESLSSKIVHATMASLEYQKAAADKDSQIEQLKEVIKTTKLSENKFQATVDELNEKLSNALNLNNELRTKSDRDFSDIASLLDQLSAKTATEVSLCNEIEQLKAELKTTKELLDKTRDAQEQAEKQNTKLDEDKAALEKKVQEEAEVVSALIKNTTEYYVRTTRTISELEAELEKAKMEETARSVSGPTSEQQHQLSDALSKYEILQERYSKDKNEMTNKIHLLEKEVETLTLTSGGKEQDSSKILGGIETRLESILLQFHEVKQAIEHEKIK